VKRSHIVLIGALAAMLTASTPASGQSGAPGAHVARRAKLQLRQTNLGKILVNSSGFTLYEFTRDSHKKNRCVRISGCSGVWPALSTSGKPTAGPGVKTSLISTIKLPGGATQVTYAGHPLYTYSADFGPGQTSYVGVTQFGGKWYALSAAGHSVK
jgi:predicted lipoprotein with Yx(FWY)xxD motif